MNPSKTWTAGTLTYTKAGLFGLFAFLLWGDFCFWMMESVPGILPLKFRELGASNKVISALLTTVPNLRSTFVNSVISCYSDRFRSRWGRRIPFLAGTKAFRPPDSTAATQLTP